MCIISNINLCHAVHNIGLFLIFFNDLQYIAITVVTLARVPLRAMVAVTECIVRVIIDSGVKHETPPSQTVKLQQFNNGS